MHDDFSEHLLNVFSSCGTRESVRVSRKCFLFFFFFFIILILSKLVLVIFIIYTHQVLTEFSFVDLLEFQLLRLSPEQGKSANQFVYKARPLSRSLKQRARQSSVSKISLYFWGPICRKRRINRKRRTRHRASNRKDVIDVLVRPGQNPHLRRSPLPSPLSSSAGLVVQPLFIEETSDNLLR